MKTTGMVRQLDSLGRVVLPIEIRRTLDINTRDMLEILVEGNSIILRKFESACHFCGSSRELTPYREKMICRRCIADLKSL